MKKAILATKVGMTQIFDENGVLIPVTVLQAGPCVVTQVKTVDNDGYKAVQVGFVDKREKLVNKPVKGHFDKAGVSYKRYVRELKLENAEEYSVKDEIKADIFAAGDKIDGTARITIWQTRSRQTSLRLATRLTQPRSPKVRDSRARSRDLVSTEDRWLTVPSSIVIRVPMVPLRLPAAYSRARECLVRWATSRSPFRILRSLRLTPRTTCFW